MSNGSGLNTSEVEQALSDLKSNGGNAEEIRYLERVLESRGVRKASVSSHEIVEGNPDAYPEHTVEEQKDLADGRPHEPVASADLGVRGSEEAPVDDSGDAPKASPRSSAKK